MKINIPLHTNKRTYTKESFKNIDFKGKELVLEKADSVKDIIGIITDFEISDTEITANIALVDSAALQSVQDIKLDYELYGWGNIKNNIVSDFELIHIIASIPKKKKSLCYVIRNENFATCRNVFNNKVLYIKIENLSFENEQLKDNFNSLQILENNPEIYCIYYDKKDLDEEDWLNSATIIPIHEKDSGLPFLKSIEGYVYSLPYFHNKDVILYSSFGLVKTSYKDQVCEKFNDINFKLIFI